jgi:hypothetical protein
MYSNSPGKETWDLLHSVFQCFEELYSFKENEPKVTVILTFFYSVVFCLASDDNLHPATSLSHKNQGITKTSPLVLSQ